MGVIPSKFFLYHDQNILQEAQKLFEAHDNTEQMILHPKQRDTNENLPWQFLVKSNQLLVTWEGVESLATYSK